MHVTTPVTTLDLPELQPFRTLRRQEEHRRRGVFVAEGRLVVERLLDSPLEVLSVLASPVWLARLQGSLERRPAPVQVFVASPAVLAEIVGYHAHQGVMALGRVPQAATLSEFLASGRTPALFLALDGVANPENLGLIVRTAAAMGVTALVAGENAADPWLRRAVRTSMGAIFRLPVCKVGDLVATLTQLRAHHHMQIMAACPRNGIPIWHTDFSGHCCLVLGHEGEGVRPAVASACSHQVTIPMHPGPDSLNVAGAAAVLLYEAFRQRILAADVTP